MNIIYVLLVAHFVGDFICQSDWMALNKSKSWDALAWHVAVYMFAMACVVGAITGGLHTNPDALLNWIGVNALAHFAQDAITSRITSRLWFFRMHEGAWRHIDVPSVRGTAIEDDRLYNPFVFEGGNRHWFFVAIGFDQLLHYTTLFVTAGWWLK